MRIEKVTQSIKEFRDERDWAQFHTPKELAISLSVEASELLECFQWKSPKEVEELIAGDGIERISDEIADVGTYLLLLCDTLGIDLTEAIYKKIKKNQEKYPVHKARGSNKKYSEL